MNRSDPLMTFARRVTMVMVTAGGIAAALVILASSSYAAQTSAPLTITVNLQTGNAIPNAGLCTAVGAFAARVTVTCSDAGFRFMLSPRTDMAQERETGYAGVGIATSWRMISLGNREYIEMMVRW